MLKKSLDLEDMYSLHPIAFQLLELKTEIISWFSNGLVRLVSFFCLVLLS